MKNYYFKQLFAALLLLCSTVATAHDFEVDGIYYNTLLPRTVEVTYKGSSSSQYSGEYSGVVIIPSSVTYNGINYSVTSIGDFAFYGCTGLTDVTIGNGVTSIGSDAFEGCTGLTKVIIGNGVTSISREAFYGCSGLTNVTIGNGVTRIGYTAFYGCKGLKSITIPNSVTNIENYAFEGCI